jgi:hypothetical protein
MQAQLNPDGLIFAVRILIGLVGVLVVGGALALLGFLAVRHIIWHRRWLHEERQARLTASDEAGEPLPPLAEGVCGACGQPFRQVFHLPDGRRLCHGCYAQQEQTQEEA